MMSFLSECIDREYKTISVQCLTPALVATKMTYYEVEKTEFFELKYTYLNSLRKAPYSWSTLRTLLGKLSLCLVSCIELAAALITKYRSVKLSTTNLDYYKLSNGVVDVTDAPIPLGNSQAHFDANILASTP
jgi:hypothetical protein